MEIKICSCSFGIAFCKAFLRTSAFGRLLPYAYLVFYRHLLHDHLCCSFQMSATRVLVYLLRKDLRFSDNPILNEVSKTFQQSQHPYTHLLPVYIFPAQQIEVSGFIANESDRSPFPEARSNAGGFWRCGHHRAKFLAESVWDVKKALERVGSGLALRVGMAGQVIKELLDALKSENTEISAVWMTEEEGVEEKREERDVRKAAEGAGTEFKLWTDEKYYVDELAIPHASVFEI